MGDLPRVVGELADQLSILGWVSDLLVAGSLATGDHVPGVSDLDWSRSSTDRSTRPGRLR